MPSIAHKIILYACTAYVCYFFCYKNKNWEILDLDHCQSLWAQTRRHFVRTDNLVLMGKIGKRIYWANENVKFQSVARLMFTDDHSKLSFGCHRELALVNLRNTSICSINYIDVCFNTCKRQFSDRFWNSNLRCLFINYNKKKKLKFTYLVASNHIFLIKMRFPLLKFLRNCDLILHSDNIWKIIFITINLNFNLLVKK